MEGILKQALKGLERALMANPVQKLPEVAQEKLPTKLRAEGYNQLAKPSTTAIAHTKDEKLRIAEIVEQCFHSLDRYGRDAATLKTTQRIFISSLAEYPVTDVLKAFSKHIEESSKFPTPSDIIGIIKKRIKLDPVLYAELLKKRKTSWLSAREENYIRKYEEQTMGE